MRDCGGRGSYLQLHRADNMTSAVCSLFRNSFVGKAVLKFANCVAYDQDNTMGGCLSNVISEIFGTTKPSGSQNTPVTGTANQDYGSTAGVFLLAEYLSTHTAAATWSTYFTVASTLLCSQNPVRRM